MLYLLLITMHMYLFIKEEFSYQVPQWPNKGILVHDISFETCNLKTLNE